MDKVTIYRVLWSTLKLDATNRHGLADVITLEDHKRALDAERERLKGQIDYSIQLQRLIESLKRDDTPSPELYHHIIIVDFKRQLATLQAQVKQLDRTLVDVYQQRDGLQAQLRQVEGASVPRSRYDALNKDWLEEKESARRLKEVLAQLCLEMECSRNSMFVQMAVNVRATLAAQDAPQPAPNERVEYARLELAALFSTPGTPTLEQAKLVCENKNPADAQCILNAYEALREAAQDAPHPTEERHE